MIIKVIDSNDSPPKFTQKEYNIEVDESKNDVFSQTAILIVSVEDADLITTNTFVYKIVNDSEFISEHFSLTSENSSASLKVINPLDYEVADHRSINFTIAVSDNGNFNDEKHIDYANVNIKLRDVNDHSPHFINLPNQIIIPEDFEKGNVIAKLSTVEANQAQSLKLKHKLNSNDNSHSTKNIQELFAVDEDDASNGNGAPLTFKIDPSASDVIQKSFKILHEDNSKAFLYSRISFDRDEKNVYQIPIVIKDSGHPALTRTATLTVSIGNKSQDYLYNITVISAIVLCLINIPCEFA